MIRVSSILVALCLFFALAQAQDSCQVSASLTRRVGSDWTDAGKQYTIYDVSVVNTGTCDLEVIHLMFMLPTGGTISQAWNLEALGGGVWSLMNFGPTLTPGTTFTGAGIVLAFTDQATISVSIARNTCVSTCQLPPTTPPTSAPTTPPTSAPTTPPTSAPTTPPTGSPATPPPVTQELIEDLILAATEVDRQALLEDQQFVFDFKNSLVGITQSAGGKTVSANRKDFPAVIGHNIAMTVGFIEACGINLPHTHPRATEINFIASGRFQAGMFQENGARFIGNVLEAGMATVFPQGAIHFEINLECEPAVFVAAFNNEDPGVQTTANSFFGLPKDVTAVSLNTSITTVEGLARFLPMNPAVAMQECMQRCGFAK